MLLHTLDKYIIKVDYGNLLESGHFKLPQQCLQHIHVSSIGYCLSILPHSMFIILDGVPMAKFMDISTNTREVVPLNNSVT